MQSNPKRHAGSRGMLVTIALTLVAATVTVGVALGQRPEAGKAARRAAAAVAPVPSVARDVVPARDLSLPAAADVLDRALTPAEEAPPTF